MNNKQCNEKKILEIKKKKCSILLYLMKENEDTKHSNHKMSGDGKLALKI